MREPKPPPVAPVARPCKQCGIGFTPLRRRTAEFCSSKCAEDHRRGRPAKQEIQCVVCGELFWPSRLDRTVCTKRCRNRLNTLQRSPAARARRKQASTALARREWQRRYRQTPGGRAKSRARSKWRRAQTGGADVVETFDSHEIFERDGWRCHRCGKRVSRVKKHPDPRSASLDHLIPISLGGVHSRANVACAHLGCNMAKSNRLADDQLRLLG